MTPIRFILEVTVAGTYVARSLDEPVLIHAADLAELQDQLLARFTSRGRRPIVVSVRVAEMATQHA
jgi:hypothetical protein